MKNPAPPESKHKKLHVKKIEKPGSMKGLGVLGLPRGGDTHPPPPPHVADDVLYDFIKLTKGKTDRRSNAA